MGGLGTLRLEPCKSMKILTLSHASPSGYRLKRGGATLPIPVRNKQDILANSGKSDYLGLQFDGSHHEGCQP
jgi:hypothetical protein